MHKINLCSGNGIKHTDTPGSKYRREYAAFPLEDLEKITKSPQRKQKRYAQWAMMHTDMSMNARLIDYLKASGAANFYCVFIDVDSGGHSADAILSALGEAAGNGVLYETSSSKEGSPRWRGIFRLLSSVTAERYEAIAVTINDHLESNGIAPDRAVERCNALCTLPNMGLHYSYVILNGKPVDPRSFDAEIAARHAEQSKIKAAHEAAIKAAEIAFKERGVKLEKYIVAAVRGKFDDALMRLSAAQVGERHIALLREGRLIGGLLHYGLFSVESAINLLIGSITGPDRSLIADRKTALAAIEAGMREPITKADICSSRAEPSCRKSNTSVARKNAVVNVDCHKNDVNVKKLTGNTVGGSSVSCAVGDVSRAKGDVKKLSGATDMTPCGRFNPCGNPAGCTIRAPACDKPPSVQTGPNRQSQNQNDNTSASKWKEWGAGAPTTVGAVTMAGASGPSQSEAPDNDDGNDDPIPLIPSHTPCADFPSECLGVIGGAAKDVADQCEAPLPIAIGAALAGAALSVCGLSFVRLPHGEIKPTSLYIATLAASNDRKSSVERRVLMFARAVQREVDASFTAEGDQIQYRHILLGSPTLPAVMNGFRTTPIAGIFSDEASAFLGGYAMRESGMETLAAFNLLYDGHVPRDTRIMRTTPPLYDRAFCAHLQVQPGIAAEALINNDLAAQNGFLSRFLISQPDSLRGTRFSREKWRDTDAISTYQSLAKKHLSAAIESANEDNECQRVTLRFSRVAEDEWYDYRDSCERLLSLHSGNILPQIARSPEQAARIAAVIQMFAGEGEEISQDATLNAICIAKWYRDEAIRIAGLAAPNKILTDAHKMATWLKSRGQSIITTREMTTYSPFRTASKVRVAMSILVDYHWAGVFKRDSFDVSKIINCF